MNSYTYQEIRDDPSILDGYKSRERVPMRCHYCQKVYHTIKKTAMDKVKIRINNFCSSECISKHKTETGVVIADCKNCGKTFSRSKSRLKQSINNFCSSSCSGTYNNKNKKHGTRRSKLERWLEDQFFSIYPNLEFHFNRKDAIGSELDIYIPSLKLAFELNGIFHYEPIYGEDKLEKIQENDSNKFQQCHKNGISLCIVDTSQHSYVTPKTSKKYLDIITNIIDKEFASHHGTPPRSLVLETSASV
jgi:hypothetical protein